MVEQPSDVIPIERSGEFHGRYHVLGGALSPIDGVDPEDLHIAELLGRVSNGGGVREVVIATNATTTGEATALYIADALRERAPDVAVTRLASGLPVGSDLEYADEITLGSGARRRAAGSLRRQRARQLLTSIAMPERRDEVRRHLRRRRRAHQARRAADRRRAEEGNRVVAVLSARGKTTDELVRDGPRGLARARTRARWTCCSRPASGSRARWRRW